MIPPLSSRSTISGAPYPSLLDCMAPPRQVPHVKTLSPIIAQKIYPDALTMKIYRVLTSTPASRKEIMMRLWREYREDFDGRSVSTACLRLLDYGMAARGRTEDGLRGWKLRISVSA